MRLIVSALTFLAWAGLAIAVPALIAAPVLGLVPLLVLAVGFEIVFAAHVGVERIGRYLQAKYEQRADGLPGWEHAAMRLGGRPGGGAGIDPLFAGFFTSAALLNLVPIALLSLDGPEIVGVFPLELTVYGLLHAVFVGRIVIARRWAATQRERDLAAFTAES